MMKMTKRFDTERMFREKKQQTLSDGQDYRISIQKSLDNNCAANATREMFHIPGAAGLEAYIQSCT